VFASADVYGAKWLRESCHQHAGTSVWSTPIRELHLCRRIWQRPRNQWYIAGQKLFFHLECLFHNMWDSQTCVKWNLLACISARVF